MSKYQKKRNPPVASSDGDENVTQDLLPTPRTVVPVIETMAEEVAAPEAINRDVTSPHQQPENAWRKVSEQLDLLRAVVIQLVSLIMENMVAGPSALTSPGKNDQESAVDILAGASASATAAITRGEKDAQPDAAILGGTGEARTESAILRISQGTSHEDAGIVLEHRPRLRCLLLLRRLNLNPNR
ncbi:unnamed protein product [Lampetra fluviatilis]